MNRKRAAVLAIVSFICGTGAFLNARMTVINRQEAGAGPSRQWLSEASGAAIELEERFEAELNGLTSSLAQEQKSLALALEDPCSPNEVVLERTENVIGAHGHLMRRVGEHVVELRGKLPASNQDYLMGLCAEIVRGPISRTGGRVGGGRQDGFGGPGPRGRGNGYVRGVGAGRGSRAGRGGGGGYGMRLRARDRLARRLRLDEGQVSILRDRDSGFEADSMRLRDILMAERAALLALFEDSKSADEELLQQIDKLILAHSQIERRIAEHVLVLRPYLTVEQQKWLIGLCRRNHEEALPAEGLIPFRAVNSRE
ncbi:MAG: hypothetical protein AMJ65_05545 [Phycisphaerae bacterium SG8_4]|nr:MAG: hypothetical protein AMJ65_05545 [Phycisphaerae bacterium SG8_4]